MQKNLTLVSLICDKCNSEYTIQYITIKKRKRKNLPNFCKKCMHDYMNQLQKEKWNNKTDEEKYQSLKALEEYGEKLKNDPILAKQHKKAQQQGFDNRSDELRKKESENKSKAQIKRFEDPFEKEKQSKRSQLRWDNTSDEDKKVHGELIKKGIQTMSEEAIKQHKINVGLATKDRHRNMSIEEKKDFSDAIKEGMKLPYEDHVEQERKIILRRNEKSFNNLLNIIKNKLNDINHLEKDFIMLLINNNIKFRYQWYNIYEHPKFHELFPNNPITGGRYVSPFHRWDFSILTNKCDIFVDIDGSIHKLITGKFMVTDECGRKFNLVDKQQFDSSQRIYQTDNSPAYIIQCYNDKLILNNPVINIYDNNNIMTLEEFIHEVKKYNKSY